MKLDSLNISKQPDKTNYKSGDFFNPTGMIVTAQYENGFTLDVIDYIVSPQILTDGVQGVTIIYTEGGISKKVTVPITVKKTLVSISVTEKPSKIEYDYLELFDSNGMQVDATYSDGSLEVVSDYTYPKTVFSKLGRQPVEIGYTRDGVTKTTILNVTVNPIEVAVPVQNGTIIYTGMSQTPSWIGYNSLQMTMSGEINMVNAGTYMTKFSLNYGYVFPGNVSEAIVEWAIDRAYITSLPFQSSALAADGKPQAPKWDNYHTDQLIIEGDRFGTMAGDYIATFTPTSNYKWWDESIDAKEVKWTINSVVVSIPVQRGTMIYTGAPQSPSWDNFDLENSSVQLTPATSAGVYYAVFTLLAGMWEDGTTGKKKIEWAIERAILSAVPRQIGSLKYDGNPKNPCWDSNYDSHKMDLFVDSKINVGTGYEAAFIPNSNYQWWDGTTGVKTATWSIESSEGFDTQLEINMAIRDMDAMNVDQEFRLTLLELGLMDLDI